MPFLIFILIELWVLFTVADHIGGWWTLLLVIGTAMLGSGLIKHQGVAVLHRAQRKLDEGESPAAEMVTGLCLLIGGVFLVLPGVITDVTGIILLIPGIRGLLFAPIFKAATRSGGFQYYSQHTGYSRYEGGNTYEGEVQRDPAEEGKPGQLPHGGDGSDQSPK